jgi:hypothetical protein
MSVYTLWYGAWFILTLLLFLVSKNELALAAMIITAIAYLLSSQEDHRKSNKQ